MNKWKRRALYLSSFIPACIMVRIDDNLLGFWTGLFVIFAIGLLSAMLFDHLLKSWWIER